ncbi:MAG TPA: aldehyde dehydrogenase family protein [Pseudonocardia sp.]|jgi:acyl-CoA reductase-like NAD-dependent aldehyde dehydrogenase
MTTPFWVAGKPVTSTEIVTIYSPFDGSVAGRHALPTDADVEAAVAAAAEAAAETAALPLHVRADALDHVSRALDARRDEFAAIITAESGKPLKWAQAEAGRAVATFRFAAEEARRFSPTMQRLDTDAAGVGRLAMIRRVSRGPVLGISPFNFPLNLVAHKVAPAIAAGSPIVLKPAPATPLTALLLGELLAETQLPAGSWSVLPVPNSAAPALVADPRLPVVSFTGSVPVGWGIKESVPRKQVVLELGGNGAVLVAPDWTDIDTAARKLALFSMYQAGQVCIAVQRVYVHVSRYEELRDKIVAATHQLTVGDPRDAGTDVGPMISQAAAERAEAWVRAAVAAGATLLTGGDRDGALLRPTVLAEVPEDAAVMADEVFAPVLSINPVQSVEEGFDKINASRFGLQAGVFTSDLHTAFEAAAKLAVGGVVIGDVPSYRADQMPYGGMKDSGVGREGPASAMIDFTEEQVTIFTGLPL